MSDIVEVVADDRTSSTVCFSHLLDIHVIQVILDKLNGCIEIGLVKLIWDVPAQRSILSPLLNSRMKECHTVQHWPPLDHVAHIQKILTDTCKIQSSIIVF